VNKKTDIARHKGLSAHLTNERLSLYKRIGIWGYGFVVVLVLAAMVYTLNTAGGQPQHIATITEDELQAVLSGPEGAVTVPISNLEDLIPVAAKEPAWRAHAASWQKYANQKHIAIVIDDLGLDENVSKQLALVDGPLTLSFLPYAEGLPQQTKMLRNIGHEIMVHLPMEPKNTNADPGPNALLSTVDYDEFERRVLWNLNRFDGFVGINNHMGSALTENPGLMVRVMVQLRKKGYLFLDSLTSPNSVGASAAIATGVPYIERDIFLDNDRDISAILAQLAQTERIARQRGYAIAIGHPYEETMKALQFWSAKLDKNTFSLVPISQLVAAKQNNEGRTIIQSR